TASSDDNFSVSSVQVITPKARTACAYNSGANSSESLSCAYDGTLTTSIQIPQTGLSINFTIPSAGAYLFCSHGTSTKKVTVSQATDALCSAKLYPAPLPGAFCSGSCASDNTATVLTLAQLDSVSFQFTDFDCGSTDTGHLPAGLEQAAAQAAGTAVQ